MSEARNQSQARQRVREAPVQREQPPEQVAGLNCPACQAANEATAQFCEECGAPLAAPAPQACPDCGEANAADALFCEGCGRALRTEQEVDPPPVAEQIAPEAQAAPLDKQNQDAAATSPLDMLSQLAETTSEAAPAPLPELAKEGQLERSKEQAKVRFKSRAEEVNAILAAFERTRQSMDRLSHGLNHSPRIRLWLCNHENGYHLAPNQCARPEKGGRWEMVREDDFKKMSWVPESS
jgi:hypothetical protein